MNDEILFHQALERPAPERGIFLDEACAGDAALRRRVEALLHAHDNPGSFLQAPAVNFAATTDSNPADAVRGAGQETARGEGAERVIGPYQLLEQIGEGGMGTVWLAEQTRPVQRKVAVKVIRAGMDSGPVLARFEAERQALALMDHPNIARVLEAGTTPEGKPYFVMELVKGLPITRYCDEHRLTPRQRLELFVPVCQAIQHAHQKGIIHRDIKPSNVLVATQDGKPVAKVIDFGIAKATGPRLTERTLFTEIGAVVGTLEYMSPEQAELNNQDIDTRSDIYALGVLLYELLTGTTPLERKRFQAAAFLEVLRLIREEEPPRASTRLSTAEGLPSIAANRGVEPRKLSGLLRGELDWILMKALEKERHRRYETANGLGMEIQRYLADETVQACPPSAAYRLRKLAHRNKAALTTAAVVVAALLLGTAFSTWQAIRATRARDAEHKTHDALDAARDEKDQQQTRTNRELSEALAEAARLCEKARTARPGETEGRRQLRETLRGAEALAGSELADPVLVRRVKALEAELKQDEADRRMVARLEEIRLNQAELQAGQISTFSGGTRPAYETAFREYGLPIFDLETEEAARRIAASPIRDWLVAALDDCAGNDGPLIETLLPIARHVERNDPWRRQYFDARMRNDLPALLRLARQPEAVAQSRIFVCTLANRVGLVDRPAALALLREGQRQCPADLWINGSLADILSQISMQARSSEVAIRYSEESVGFQRAAVAVRPESPALQVVLAGLLGRSGHYDEAIAVYDKSIQLKPDSSSAYNGLGWTLVKKGGPQGAVKGLLYLSKGIELEPGRAYQWYVRGLAYEHLGQFDHAISDYSKAIDLQPRSAYFRWVRGVVYARRSQNKSALADFSKAVDLDPLYTDGWFWRGNAHRRLGQRDMALGDYSTAIRLNPQFAECYCCRAEVLAEVGQWENAAADCSKIIELNPNDFSGWSGRGHAYFELRRWNKAAADFSHLVEMAPNNAEVWVNRGAALNNMGQYEKGAADNSRAIELSPANAVAWKNRAWALVRLQRWDKAAVDYSEVIKLTPADASAWGNRGRCHVELGSFRQARADFEKVVELTPSPAAHNQLAWFLATCAAPEFRDPPRAVELAGEAVKMLSRDGACWNTLGVARYRAGDWKLAVEALAKSVELRQGGDACDGFFLAMAHEKLGNRAEARTWYDRAVAWMDKNQPKDAELCRFRAEAAAALRLEPARKNKN